MHEFSMAQSAVEKILEIAREHRARRVRSVKLIVGELTFLNMEQLRFALKVLSKGTIMEGCKFDLVTERLKVKCRRCGFESESEYSGREHHVPNVLELTLSLKCPRCGCPDVDILSGRSFTVKGVKIIVGGR